MDVDREDVLVLVQGSARPFELRFLDEHDNSEDLSNVAAATLRIVGDPSDPGGTEILSRSTAASNLSIDSAESKIVGTLEQAEADALPTGIFIAAASVQFAGGSEWHDTDPIHCVITPAIASHP